MNSNTSAPVRATSKPSKAGPPTAKPEAAQAFTRIVQSLRLHFQQLRELDEPDTNGFSSRISRIASGQLEALLAADDLPRDQYAHCLFDIEALCVGAHDAGDTSPARKSILAASLKLLDEATEIVCPGGPDAAARPRIPHAAPGKQQRSLGDRQAAWTFSAISSAAESIRQLRIDIVQEDINTWETTILKVMAVGHLADQIGVLADIGMVDCGESSMVRHDDPRGWLLPPAYHAEAEGGQS